jgi:hypothetical protein
MEQRHIIDMATMHKRKSFTPKQLKIVVDLLKLQQHAAGERQPAHAYGNYDEAFSRITGIRRALSGSDEALIAKVTGRFGFDSAQAIEGLWRAAAFDYGPANPGSVPA